MIDGGGGDAPGGEVEAGGGVKPLLAKVLSE
jgi:hypothetical protein